MNNIDEGIFFSDKQITTTRKYRTEEEAESEKNEILNRYKNRSPVTTSKKAKIDKYGKFYFEIKYHKNANDDDKSLSARSKRLFKKDDIENKSDTVTKDVVKSVSDSIMINDKLTTKNPSAEKARLQSLYNRVKILSTEKNTDGSYTIKFERSKTKKQDTSTKEPDTKTEYDNDGIELINQLKIKISNIEKQIRKLIGK